MSTSIKIHRPQECNRRRRMGQDKGNGNRRAIDPFSFSDAIECRQELGGNTLPRHKPATAKGTPGKRRRPVLHALVEGSVAQRSQMGRRILRLIRGDRKRKMCTQRRDLRWRVVRNPDRTNLSGLSESIEARRDFGRMSKKVRSVNLIQIDAINPKTLE